MKETVVLDILKAQFPKVLETNKNCKVHKGIKEITMLID